MKNRIDFGFTSFSLKRCALYNLSLSSISFTLYYKLSNAVVSERMLSGRKEM